MANIKNMPSFILPPNASLAQGDDGVLYLVTQTINPVHIARPSNGTDSIQRSNEGSAQVGLTVGRQGSSVPKQAAKILTAPSVASDISSHAEKPTSPAIQDTIMTHDAVTEPSNGTSGNKKVASPKKFKTVKVKMNGVIQTLLVPAVPEKDIEDATVVSKTATNPVQDCEISQSNGGTVKSLPEQQRFNILKQFKPATSILKPNAADKKQVILLQKEGGVSVITNMSAGEAKQKNIPMFLKHNQKVEVNGALKTKSASIPGANATKTSSSETVLRNVLSAPPLTQLVNRPSWVSTPNAIKSNSDKTEDNLLRIESVYSIKCEKPIDDIKELSVVKPSVPIADDISQSQAQIINIEPQIEALDYETGVLTTSETETESKEKLTVDDIKPSKKPETKISRLNLKRKANKQGLGCRNCPGCNAFNMKPRRPKQEVLEIKSEKELVIQLTRIETGTFDTLSIRKLKRLNPNLRIKQLKRKHGFARKSTTKPARNVQPPPCEQETPTDTIPPKIKQEEQQETKAEEPSIVPPLNFSKYYLVKSPAGTFLVPRATEIDSDEPEPVLFRVVNHNTGRAVAIRTSEGVQKMFVEEMDPNDTPVSLEEHLAKLPKKRKLDKIRVKTEPFANGFCDREKKVSDLEIIIESDHSDTDSASEMSKNTVSESELNATTEQMEDDVEPPVLEPESSATERLDKLREKLKAQMKQLDQVRSNTESAKRLLESIDEDEV